MWTILLLTLTLPQEEVQLRYNTEAVQRPACVVEGSLRIRIEGTADLVEGFRPTSVLYAFDRIQWKGQGSPRRFDKQRWVIGCNRVRIEGVYDDAPFKEEFVATGSYPKRVKESPFLGLLWYVTMGGKPYVIDDRGRYRPAPHVDAEGEASDLIDFTIVRFPRKKIKVGESWVMKWTSTSRDPVTQARFHFRQKSTLVRIGKGVATIRSRFTGSLRAPNPKARREGKSCRATMTLHLDLKSGEIVSRESRGRIVRFSEGFDDGAGASKLSITLERTSRVTPQK